MQKIPKQYKARAINEWTRKDFNLTKVTKENKDSGGNMIMFDQ